MLHNSVLVEIAQFGPIGFRGRRGDAVFHPVVQDINQTVDDSGKVQDLDVSIFPVFEVFASGMTDPSNLVRPCLIPQTFVSEYLGIVSFVNDPYGSYP